MRALVFSCVAFAALVGCGKKTADETAGVGSPGTSKTGPPVEQPKPEPSPKPEPAPKPEPGPEPKPKVPPAPVPGAQQGGAVPPAPLRPPVTIGRVILGIADGDVTGHYHDNIVAADKKWKGTRAEFDLAASGLGRLQNGTLWISVENIADSPDNVFFYLASGQEEKFATVKRGTRLAIRGTCAGREDDRIPRALRGYDFRVNFVDCELVEVIPPPPKK